MGQHINQAGGTRGVPLVIHARITRACNADCSYCSSWQESPNKRMSPSHFQASLEWVIEKYASLGVSPNHITVEYVGGEILTIPNVELEKIVSNARKYLSSRGIVCYDGVQTNLIGSERNVSFLDDLFEGRIGTSIDRKTNNRTVNGSAKKYRVMFIESENSLLSKKKTVSRIPAIITITQDNISHVAREVLNSEIEGRNITVRPVFEGGKEIGYVGDNDLRDLLVRLFHRWFMGYRIKVEPLYSLFTQLLVKNIGSDIGSYVPESEKENYTPIYNTEMCPFQSNCATRSLSIEPNGDIYICQDMADAGVYKLGNSLKREFDVEIFNKLRMREQYIEKVCHGCEYIEVCNGGCMVHSVQYGDGMYAKTPYCGVWKDLLSEMELALNDYNMTDVVRWYQSLVKGER